MSDVKHEDVIAQLRTQNEELREEARQLAEGHKAVDLKDKEIARLEEIESLTTHNDEQIAHEERIIRLTGRGSAGGDGATNGQRRTEPWQQGQARTQDGGRQSYMGRQDPTAGFANMGEFMQHVARAGKNDAQSMQRLAQLAPSTYSSEGAGGDGGYLIPPEFTQQVMEYINEEHSIYSKVDKTPVNNHLNWPVDEEAPWSTSGPQAYWEGESDQYTQSKLKIRTAGMRLNKLVALCPVTDELMEDAPQLAAYLRSVISKKLRWKVDFGILQGTGVGMPLGILNAPCLKSVAKEAGQAADTVTSTNILKMYNALFGDFRGGASWLHNQDVEPQLMQMVLAGSSSDVPVYLPSGTGYGALAGSPQSLLMGRPIYPHQACETIGDHGDIVLGDWSQYVVGYKSAGPQFAESIHLYFDYGMTAVRATWRLAGMPKWSTPIAARDGSATYSPFVSLAARA